MIMIILKDVQKDVLLMNYNVIMQMKFQTIDYQIM